MAGETKIKNQFMRQLWLEMHRIPMDKLISFNKEVQPGEEVKCALSEDLYRFMSYVELLREKIDRRALDLRYTRDLPEEDLKEEALRLAIQEYQYKVLAPLSEFMLRLESNTFGLNDYIGVRAGNLIVSGEYKKKEKA